MSNQPVDVELTLNYPGERLDKALTMAMPQLSRMQWRRLIDEGMVKLGERPLTKPSLKLEGGEQVVATLPEVQPTDLLPEDIPLDIRYEDGDMIVINKPADMVVHPGTGHYSGTLANAVLFHCPDLKGVGGEMRPGIVHRLDKGTSGLIVVAKHDQALWHLQKQFKKRTVRKKYLALVEGQLQPPAALIDVPIGRDPTQRKKMAVIRPHPTHSLHARPAQTQYRTMTAYDDFTFIECDLFTGRTHQIRVHLAYIKHPVVGDSIYGRRKRKFDLKRHFLHAAELVLKRPSDEQELTFRAELPPELQAILDLLDNQ
ncbi:MAG: RluA family pseudouridine synthase [Ardenticatenaceae bacterium]|nr:RluA family pseudouridine synthase [Anaerolineales bacterium]MCB8921086.1 RluA family pseudouridine synthase [Ardenticatenaceae bacterium]MCB9005359.1 RluA family pseudouridine synthase [Ardenticatenaceae bacterium]